MPSVSGGRNYFAGLESISIINVCEKLNAEKEKTPQLTNPREILLRQKQMNMCPSTMLEITERR